MSIAIDHDDFLQAIAADPKDDSLRLVYADWLEDRGDARAEYLRLEVQAIHTEPESDAYREIDSRLGILRAEFDPQWLIQISGEMYLLKYEQRQTINTIKLIREITACGLKEASDVVWGARSSRRLRTGVPWYQLVHEIARLNKRYPGEITFEGRPTLAGKEVKR
jgi:uncharacterized protein (TIGR02996 family)